MPHPLDPSSNQKPPPSPLRRLKVLLIIGAWLALAAFIASFIITVVYVGGG